MELINCNLNLGWPWKWPWGQRSRSNFKLILKKWWFFSLFTMLYLFFSKFWFDLENDLRSRSRSHFKSTLKKWLFCTNETMFWLFLLIIKGFSKSLIVFRMIIIIIIIILSFPPHFVPPTKTFVSRHIEKIFHHMYRSYLTGLISPFRKLIFFSLRSYLPKHRKHCYH